MKSKHYPLSGPATVVGCHETSWYVSVGIKLDDGRTGKVCASLLTLLKEKK